MVFHGLDSMVDEMVRLCWAGTPTTCVTSVTEQTVALPIDDGFSQLKTERLIRRRVNSFPAEYVFKGTAHGSGDLLQRGIDAEVHQ